MARRAATKKWWTRWRATLAYLILAVGVTIAIAQVVNVANHNRNLIVQNQKLIEKIANDCVDRDGDIAFREVMKNLIKLNKAQPPPDPAVRSKQTIKILQDGYDRAGETPPCIVKGGEIKQGP